MPLRERSMAHPSATWSECMSLIRELDGLGKGAVSLEVLASAFQIKNWKTKSFQSKITSSRQFGLINLKSGAVSLTEDAYTLLHPTVPDIRSAELSLFSRPDLYGKLLSAYEGKSLPRRDLFENILVANYGISDTAKKKAAEVFIASAEELGVLSNGIVSYNNAVAAASDSTPLESSDSAAVSDASEAPLEASGTVSIPQSSQSRSFTLSIPSADGSCSIDISIPDGASADDLDMARDMLEIYARRMKGQKREDSIG